MIGLLKKIGKPLARVAGFAVGGGVGGEIIQAAAGATTPEPSESDPLLTLILAAIAAIYRVVVEIRNRKKII